MKEEQELKQKLEKEEKDRLTEYKEGEIAETKIE